MSEQWEFEAIYVQDGTNNPFKSKMSLEELQRITCNGGLANSEYLCIPKGAYMPQEFTAGLTHITDVLVPQEMICSIPIYFN